MKRGFIFSSFLLLVFVVKVGIGADEATITKQKEIVHRAHLSTAWYHQDKNVLNGILKIYFDIANKDFDVVTDPGSVKALIVPHAGTYFSGLCAASAYQTLFENKTNFEKNKKIKRVIILCPSHVKAFDGICLPDYDRYSTVLGDIKVDKDSIGILKQHALFKTIPGVHCPEHAIEIQLPFLQKTVENFSIVPLVVGFLKDNDYGESVHFLKKIIDDKTLIVISSDFTHHGKKYDYDIFNTDVLDNIRFSDSLALQAIMMHSFKDFEKFVREKRSTICGQTPIKLLLKLLEDSMFTGVHTRLSCYYTSSQMQKAYDKNTMFINTNVLFEPIPDEQLANDVSYLGLIFTTQNSLDLKPEERLTNFEKKSLLTFSRRIIENAFKEKNKRTSQFLLWPLLGEGVRQSAGVFVTLHTKAGDLQGCMGRMYSSDPVYKIVQDMSKMSAFHDTRFNPLQKEKLDGVTIDITILTPPQMVKSYKEIEVGKHGIILSKQKEDRDWASAVFLPQVPLSFGWDIEKTLQQLSLKAGLGRNDWQEGNCIFYVFEGYQIKEK